MHFANIAELEKEVQNCHRCTLCQERNRVVFGEGNTGAEIMFIGEGPGQNEDLQGRPFVGAAGKFLDEIIMAMGFSRSEVYIANVVKCRPPQNRDPLPPELSACREYIDEQIRLINPRIIVTLGRFSMAMFFEKATISQIHGKPKRVGEVVYFPMYHPAAALYHYSMRNVILEDARKIPVILQKLDKMAVLGLGQNDDEEKELPSNKKEISPLIKNSLHNDESKDIIEHSTKKSDSPIQLNLF